MLRSLGPVVVAEFLGQAERAPVPVLSPRFVALIPSQLARTTGTRPISPRLLLNVARTCIKSNEGTTQPELAITRIVLGLRPCVARISNDLFFTPMDSQPRRTFPAEGGAEKEAEQNQRNHRPLRHMAC